MTWLLVIAIVVVVLAAAWMVRARRRQVTDGVDSFRRQIDALSPEARRPVVDQVQKQAEADEAPADDDEDEPDGA